MRILSLLVVLLCGCQNAPMVMRFAHIAVNTVDATYGCVSQDHDGMMAAYRDELIILFAETDAKLDTQEPFRRNVTVTLSCDVDPYGENAWGRCAYGGTHPTVYAGSILKTLAGRDDISVDMLGAIFGKVAAHEVGHAMGLKHGTGEDRVMTVAPSVEAYWRRWSW